VTALAATLEETAPDVVAKVTVQLHHRNVPEIVIDPETFDPCMLEKGDSPLIAELATRLKRAGMKVLIHVRLYSVRFELLLEKISITALEEVTALLRKVKDEFVCSCHSCGEYNIVKITG